MAQVTDEQVVSIEKLGQQLRHLRLTSAQALRQMKRSLARHGQLSALSVFRADEGALQIVDGFKRVHAARELGLAELRVRVVAQNAVQAKLALPLLNGAAGLSTLEEGWLIRSLYRQDGLTQPQIGQLLCRHKSWVCRRLMLVETLDEAVQGDVRLGLLRPSAARSLSRLPHGNQKMAADVVIRHGLTVSGAHRLVADVLKADPKSQDQLLRDLLDGQGPSPSAAPAPVRAGRTVAEKIVCDVASMTRLCGRLQARLLGQPLPSLGEQGVVLIIEALCGLQPLLGALSAQIDQVQQTGQGVLNVKHQEPTGAGVQGGDPPAPGPVPQGHRQGAGDQPQHGAQDPGAPQKAP